MKRMDEIVKDYLSFRGEYAYSPDIMGREQEKVAALKEIIALKLSPVDRAFLLMYVDCQSYRELGRRTGLSHMTCYKEVQRIKALVVNEFEKLKK